MVSTINMMKDIEWIQIFTSLWTANNVPHNPTHPPFPPARCLPCLLPPVPSVSTASITSLCGDQAVLESANHDACANLSDSKVQTDMSFVMAPLACLDCLTAFELVHNSNWEPALLGNFKGLRCRSVTGRSRFAVWRTLSCTSQLPWSKRRRQKPRFMLIS